MEIICVTQENLEKEHICCAISDRKNTHGAAAKKAWMASRFADGLIFRKLNVRGKVFIETIPAERAWTPIEAEGYLHINCFWVSGQYKGQGWANQLLAETIAEAKGLGKHGLSVVSSTKKKPFLSDPAYLKYKGFRLADSARPWFELLYLPFDEAAPIPRFKPCAKEGKITENGMVLYYTDQCPHTSQYASLIRDIAAGRGEALKLIKIETMVEAQKAPSPFTTYSFFGHGEFVTNEIFGPAKFEKYLDQRES